MILLSFRTRLPSSDMAPIRKHTTRPRMAHFLQTLKLNNGLAEQTKIAPTALRDLSGKPTTLDDHIGKGQWALVVIWASGCHVCASEIPRYGAYFASAPEPKFSILGVALDGYARKSSIIEAMNRWNMDFPSLVTERPALPWNCGELRKASPHGTPNFMLFNPSGQLKKLNAGPVWISELEEFIRNDGLE